MDQCRYCGSAGQEREYCTSCGRPFATDPNQLVTKVIGGYRLDKLVGEGPIGSVFQAHHEASGQSCRFKLVDSNIVHEAPAIRASANQLATDACIVCPRLPKLVEAALDGETDPLVVHEWIDGTTLRECLAEGPLEPPKAQKLIEGLLDILGELHGAGFVHRDIKPENVLVTKEGGVCLLDVGPSLLSELAHSGAAYRSPEQARNQEDISHRTDLYSCGALLYELFTGHPPFQATDFDVLLSQISFRQPKPVQTLCPDLAPSLVRAVTHALAQDAAERFPSAAEMKNALQGAHPPAPPQAQRKAPPAAPMAPPVAPKAPPAAPKVPPAAPKAPPAAPEAPPAPSAPAKAGDLDLPPAPGSRSSASAIPVAPPGEPDNRKKHIAAAAFVAFAAIAGGTMLYIISSGSSDEEDGTPGADEAAEVEQQGRREKRGSVRITLTDLPPRARWTVDGRQLTANPFRAPRSDIVHLIRVEAPGHEPFETSVVFTNDTNVPIKMTPVAMPDGGTPAHQGFKAYTYGTAANQRPRTKNKGGRPAKSPSVYRDSKAPTKLRGR
jgi:hypothetical protein